jgi:hypothetical protein
MARRVEAEEMIKHLIDEYRAQIFDIILEGVERECEQARLAGEPQEVMRRLERIKRWVRALCGGGHIGDRRDRALGDCSDGDPDLD